MSDWQALAAQHGPQQAAYRRAESAPPAPRCGGCGKPLKPPAIVVTRCAALCPACAAALPPDDRPDPPLYGGRRIEDLTIEAWGLFERLTFRSYLGGQRPDDAPVYGIWTGRGRRPRTTWGQVRRARLAAYRRFWRRKRLWLTR